MSPKLARPIGRPIGLCVALTAPALILRLAGVHPAAALSLAAFGTAVVAASFLLAWAAEAARLDIAGPLAIAILAVIAVLPEYAVDLYFSYTAGHNPGYVQYAAANMTGSNRLLLGLGWPVVVIISLWVASRRSGRGVRELVLQSGYRTELGFLFVASIAAFLIPLSGQISLVLGFALLGFFVFYLWKASRAEASRAGAGRARRPDRRPAAPSPAPAGDRPVRVRRGRDRGLGRTLRRVPHQHRHPARHRPVPAGAVGGPAGVGGAGVHRGHLVRGARQGLRRDRHPDLQQGQPVDAAGRQPAAGLPGRRRRDRAGAGRPPGRGVRC